MTHYCIKYRLNSDGTIPDFLCLHEEGVGGVYGVPSPGSTQHDDTVFIGLSEDNNVGNAEVIPTKEDLISYLTSISTGWTDENDQPFNVPNAADWVWGRLEALNA